MFAEGELNIAEYLPRRSRRKYSAIFTEPEVNNFFSIIFKGECEKLDENVAKHEKQMSLSLPIMPRNHRARGDYNAELLYSPLKIMLKENNLLVCYQKLC